MTTFSWCLLQFSFLSVTLNFLVCCQTGHSESEHEFRPLSKFFFVSLTLCEGLLVGGVLICNVLPRVVAIVSVLGCGCCCRSFVLLLFCPPPVTVSTGRLLPVLVMIWTLTLLRLLPANVPSVLSVVGIAPAASVCSGLPCSAFKGSLFCKA